MDVRNCEGLEFLDSLEDGSVDLVLTDPPYITSRDTGMDALWKQVHEGGGENLKTPEEWQTYREGRGLKDDPKWRENFIKYGNIYGKKYAVKTQYGDWDANFTMDDLDQFVQRFHRKLRDGGTLIIWFDIWKITHLKEMLERHKFKQIRYIEWIKTNPQPLNSKTNYLTNCREMALVAIKKSKPTFNSQYDNGIYQFPIQGGKERFHPTQKSTALFEELIRKHSNEGDVVVDPFLGSGTTLRACKMANRICKGCEVSSEYYTQMLAME
jgi:DNA modification methylase